MAQQSKENFIKYISDSFFMIKLSYNASPSVTVGRIVAFLIQRGFYGMFVNIIFLEKLMGYVESGASFNEAALFLAFSIAVMIIMIAWTTYYWNYKEPAGNQILYEKLHLKMFQKATDVELECFENPDFYNKYMKASSQIKGKAIGALNNIGFLICSIFNICFLIVKSVATDPIVLVFAVFPFIATYFFSIKANKISYKLYEENISYERRSDYVKRTMYLQDYAKEIRLSNIYNVLMDNFHSSMKNIIENIRKYGMRTTLIYFFKDSLNYTFTTGITICYVTLRLMYWKNISAADFIVLVNIILIFTENFINISERISKIQDDSQYIDNLRCFLEYKPKISESQDGIEPDGHKNVLKMENVSFTYLGKNTPTLKGINLSIEPGQKIALVGHNGAGKTTLVKLLMRLYDPTEGKISLGEHDIKKYSVKAYRNLFGTVFQDYRVMSMSVAENVIMGDVNQDDRLKVEESLKNSGVYDKVQSLKFGIDTTLTKEFDKDGAVLSGGETQKIAIARVFAKDCDFVILDEPSSALDPIAEYEMCESMLKACKDKSIIFISHRLSSAVLADKIYIMENGEIIGAGTHNDLMKQNKKYAKMFNLQARSYQ